MPVFAVDKMHSYVKLGHSIIDSDTIYDVTERKIMVEHHSWLYANT